MIFTGTARRANLVCTCECWSFQCSVKLCEMLKFQCSVKVCSAMTCLDFYSSGVSGLLGKGGEHMEWAGACENTGVCKSFTNTFPDFIYFMYLHTMVQLLNLWPSSSHRASKTSKQDWQMSHSKFLSRVRMLSSERLSQPKETRLFASDEEELPI
jgi:hypothetical protein